MVEKFIMYSKAVGNKNFLVKEEDLREKGFEKKYDIAYLPSFSLVKMLDV